MENKQKKTLIDLVYKDGKNAVIKDLSDADLAVVQGILGEEIQADIHVFKEVEVTVSVSEMKEVLVEGEEDQTEEQEVFTEKIEMVKMAHTICKLNEEEKIFIIERDEDWEKEEYADYIEYGKL